MKKYLFLVSLLATTIAFSQAKVQPEIRAGANISKISNIKGDAKTDFYLGAAIAINLGSFYTLQPEVTYTNQGGKNIYKNEGYYDNNGQYVDNISYKDFKLQYLSVAVANKFYITQNRDLHLLVAPSIDLLINDVDLEFNDNGSGYLVEDSSEFTPIDFTLSLGAGYEFPFGLGIEARYKLGVVSVIDIWDSNAKNRVFQVGLTYRFLSQK